MLLFLCGIIVAVAGICEATICHNDTDCGAGECCYIRPEFIVVSRRQLTLPEMTTNKYDTGVCEKYRAPDEHCGVFETANGHCGCVTGYSCQWVPDPTIVSAANGLGRKRRRLPAHEGPGAYKCAATTP